MNDALGDVALDDIVIQKGKCDGMLFRLLSY